MNTRNQHREELIQQIEDRIFRLPGKPRILWCDEIKPYRDILYQKSIEALEGILERIKNWSWPEVEQQFMHAVVNEEPFLPLENPPKRD